MPTKRTFCWCLGGKAPPEISYDLGNGGMTLKPIEVGVPMPDNESEIDERFTELVNELGLDRSHQEAMFNLPSEKKWQIYCSQKKDHLEPNLSCSPAYYIGKLNSMSNALFISPSASSTTDEDLDLANSRIKVIESLKTALRTQPLSFVVRFVEMEGFQSLLDILQLKGQHSMNLRGPTIGCIKALMNCSEGRVHVLSHPDGVKIISQSLAERHKKTKIAVLEILGASCLVPGGHKMVLQAMLHFQEYAGERTRFQTLVHDLDEKCDLDNSEDVSLKTAIMSFINASLKYGPGQSHLEFRLHLRYEYLMLGITPIIAKLRKIGNSTLDRHLDFFEMVRNEDEWQFAKKFETNHVDSKSANSMLDLIKKRLVHSPAYHSLLSLLYHLLQITSGNARCQVHQWQLIDRIVQQIVLQDKDGDPDCAPLDIDVKKLAKKLANESAVQEIQQKIKEVQKENEDMQSKLSKKERECEAKTEEKDELMQTLNKMRAKLEKESANHNDQLNDMSVRLEELQRLLDFERNERQQLELAVKNGSLPDDAKVGLSFLTSSAISSPAVDRGSMKPTLSLISPPPPPLPPPINPVAPPPPPPMATQGASKPGMANSYCNVPGPMTRRKNIPEPGQALKSFNWTKLSDNKVHGTIWVDIDETKIYTSLDLVDFEKSFSAYQRQETTDPDSIQSRGPIAKFRELSVIDGRRAQNCTILLSKLKVTNQELADIILDVDSGKDLPKDMCEQLLKFVPTMEEVQMLEEHEHEIESMAKADRFLYEMSRIDHYEQRLKALHYQKCFKERVDDASLRIKAVLAASQDIAASKKLKNLLELVLALGNYMNRGQRGNAPGFRIISLTRIADTKSSNNKRFTLMHYLGEIVEEKFPDLCALEDEIVQVNGAAKVNLTELKQDLKVLKSGLTDIKNELDYHKNQSLDMDKRYPPEHDRFVLAMHEFLSISSYKFSDLEEQYSEMTMAYGSTLRLFGEDPDKCQPEEFFGLFDNFLTTFTEARNENEKFRRQREEEERRIRVEAQLKAEKEAKEQAKRMKNVQEGKGDFDDLISALHSGDVFGDDMVRMKRGRRNKVINSQALPTRKRDEASRERTAPVLMVK